MERAAGMGTGEILAGSSSVGSVCRQAGHELGQLVRVA
jgi:hypothetical protein